MKFKNPFRKGPEKSHQKTESEEIIEGYKKLAKSTLDFEVNTNKKASSGVIDEKIEELTTAIDTENNSIEITSLKLELHAWKTLLLEYKNKT